MITRAFGITLDIERGTMRNWVMGTDGVIRWLDTSEPVDKPERFLPTQRPAGKVNMSTDDAGPLEVRSNDGLGMLPEWESTLEFSERALDRFIYSQEPAGESAEEFRADLAAVIAEAVAAERERCAQLCESLETDAERESGAEAAGWLEQVAALIRGA